MARSLLERLAALEASVGRQRTTPAGEPGPASAPGHEFHPAVPGAGPASDASGPSREPADEPPPGALGMDGGTGGPRDDRPQPLDSRGRGLALLGFRPLAEGDSVWHRVLRYDLLTVHGRRRFADLLSTDLSAAARALKVEAVDPERLRFYDTETTGLGQGAGNVPFLHALARVEGDELAVHQYFLADHAGEPDLLSALLTEHLTGDALVVTFNGKSFDWPLLQSRLSMWRMPRPSCGHADLIHPARRLWRRHLGRVALAEVEAGVLGIRRTDDLPGREAPARYFAWLEDGVADGMEPVFEHNAADVCSLAVLLAVLADLLAGREPAATAEAWVALARWHDDWEAYDLAERCYERAAASPDADGRALWLKSLFHKRRGEWEKALALWARIAAAEPLAVPPLVELAKYAEHRAGDLDAAARWTQEAQARAAAQAQACAADPAVARRWHQVLDHLAHRLARIQRRRALGG
ncbi:ribonuclease H-like domain-containing protein [Alicyclobacillus sp.]|uniref:ribonuclease H-like domain-containing protein n=1 Tax=Alicyclobacillus sp. TaxID=61169 RepID=UPI0025BBE672|nr:ribonuclease H-like domain-containing protein [Alicyclobacillus sp.]MCL6517121.1 ribonuclease H-like domain-containing protein [Alicyclobacillus sp.]